MWCMCCLYPDDVLLVVLILLRRIYILPEYQNTCGLDSTVATDKTIDIICLIVMYTSYCLLSVSQMTPHWGTTD